MPENIAINAKMDISTTLVVLVSFILTKALLSLNLSIFSPFIDCSCDVHGTEAEICDKENGGKLLKKIIINF
jgi:Na+-transporting NADH:ubiquinone oxidoreductase subunit NqrD